MSYARVSLAIRRLRVGEHVHLDELIDNPPAPGSAVWMPIVESVVALVDVRDGRWVVKWPLGFLLELPTSSPTISTIFEMLMTDEITMEPPSVTRLARSAVVSTWEGENHRWQVRGVGRSLAVVSVSRSLRESLGGEPYFCEWLSEIG